MSNTQKNWKAKLCQCCNNPCMSAFVCLVPFSCSFVQCINSKIMFPEGKDYCGAYFCTFLCCIGMAYNRSQLRTKLNVEGNFCLDCVCHSCCGCCSVIQEWREVMIFKYNNERLNIFNHATPSPQAPVQT